MPDVRPTPRALVLKTAARLRARGPGEVAALWARRIRENVGSDDELVVFHRAAAERARPAPPEATRFVELFPDDGRRYARDIGTESPSTFAGRLSATTTCWAVEGGDRRLLHTTWMTRTAAWTREIRRYVWPPAGDVYVYESYTAPAARGRGIYPYALGRICAEVATSGIGRVWVAVEADNPASIRAVTKAGFTETGRLAYRRRWGRLTLEPLDLPDGLLWSNLPAPLGGGGATRRDS